MLAEAFRGADLLHVADRARRALGDDVMILHTRTVRDDGVPLVEVLAAPAETVERARARLEAAPLTIPPVARTGRPYVIALVGPTGAGKTTTAAKLAIRPGTFGTARAGLLTLDTYRIGGVEQLATFAELAGVACDVAQDVDELPDALARLAGSDVVIVDTAGRSPAADDANAWCRTMLDALAPDEIHLVLPATLRADLALDVARAWRTTRTHRGATHLLVSKLDEVPSERGVADLALSLELPTRWITDGQDVPTTLRPSLPRLLRSFGLGADADPSWSPA